MKKSQSGKQDYIRTDLASESMQTAISEKAAEHYPDDGFHYSEKSENGITVTKLDITDERGSVTLGKPVGRYITISFGHIWLSGDDESAEVEKTVAREFLSLCEHCAPKSKNILVAGLGNRDIIADAIGPLTVAGLNITRHIKQHDSDLFYRLTDTEVSAVAPGVLGQTGIETLELIRGAVENVSPDLVVVIDALAARSASRLASTIQLTDTGISPGSGIANKRSAINEHELGVPVIAVGVPTVVDSSTLIYDALDQAGIEEIDGKLKAILENGRSFFVSLKEADIASHSLAKLIARALNASFGNNF